MSRLKTLRASKALAAMAVFIGIFTLGVQQAKATSLLALTQGATLSIFDKQFE